MGQILDRPGPERLETFFEGDRFVENAERDILSEYDDRFFALSDEEDLIELNSKWLRQLPNLVVISVDEMKAEVRWRASSIPDRDTRIAQLLANELRYMKLIRALCEAAGHELDCATAGDPTYEYDGQLMMVWHFLTNKGHHYMVEADGEPVMFDEDSDEPVCEVEAPDKYGTE